MKQRPGPKPKPRSKALFLVAAVVLVGAASAAFWFAHQASGGSGTITFNHDIAPIISARCAACHRPGQAAPFSLITYDDVKRHAKQIAEVTASRYMPPWLPEPGYGEFAGSRRLTDDELALLQRWIAQDCEEGQGRTTAKAAQTDEWTLGRPDLVVTMPEAYTLAAEGRDVYRNFVLPVPLL